MRNRTLRAVACLMAFGLTSAMSVLRPRSPKRKPARSASRRTRKEASCGLEVPGRDARQGPDRNTGERCRVDHVGRVLQCLRQDRSWHEQLQAISRSPLRVLSPAS